MTVSVGVDDEALLSSSLGYEKVRRSRWHGPGGSISRISRNHKCCVWPSKSTGSPSWPRYADERWLDMLLKVIVFAQQKG